MGLAEGNTLIIATAANGVAGSSALHVNGDAPPPPTTDVHFNEIHYDNIGTDAGEAIEIEGPAGMDLSGKLFDPRICFFDIVSQAGTRSQSGIAQPIVTNHALLIHIRDPAGFELPHFRECPLRTHAHRLQEIIGKPHPTDVDRETNVVITQKILLEALPERIH